MLTHWSHFIASSRKVTANQQPHHFLCDKNLATWGRIQRDERWWWSTSKEECHLLLTNWSHFIASSRKVTANQQPHHFLCDKNLATWGRIQRDERWWWSTSKRRVSSFADSLKSLYRFIPESSCKSQKKKHHFFMWQKSSHVRSHSTRRKMMMIYFKRRVSSFADSLKSLYLFIPESNCKSTTASFFMWQKSSHVRSHSTRRKMMMIYFKRRVSSFADSLKSLYRFIPESNRKSTNTLFFYAVKIKTPQVAFNATKDDEDLLQKKSVIFCWLTDVTLSLHPGK